MQLSLSLTHTPPTHSHTEGEIVDHKIYNVQIYNRYRGYQAAITNLRNINLTISTVPMVPLNAPHPVTVYLSGTRELNRLGFRVGG